MVTTGTGKQTKQQSLALLWPCTFKLSNDNETATLRRTAYLDVAVCALCPVLPNILLLNDMHDASYGLPTPGMIREL